MHVLHLIKRGGNPFGFFLASHCSVIDFVHYQVSLPSVISLFAAFLVIHFSVIWHCPWQVIIIVFEISKTVSQAWSRLVLSSFDFTFVSDITWPKLTLSSWPLLGPLNARAFSKFKHGYLHLTVYNYPHHQSKTVWLHIHVKKFVRCKPYWGIATKWNSDTRDQSIDPCHQL